MEILLATGNRGKVIELQEMLAGYNIKVLSLNDFPDFPEVEENGQTFVDNALLKARLAADKTGLLSLADDSGLEVDALNGAPGVYSARFAGEPKNDSKNIDKLLLEMEGVPEEKRTARFRCSLAVVCPGGKEHTTDGVVEGSILYSRKGEGGFGYDPVFFLKKMGKTMAELSLEEKNSLSHRAQAFKKAVPLIKSYLNNRKMA